MDIKELRELESKASRGPWRACHDGECRCKLIWSEIEDFSLAQILYGAVGDDIPVIRDGKPAIEKFAYWNIPEEVGIANAQFIIALRNAASALFDEVERLRKENADLKEYYANIMETSCREDEKHCTCVPALRYNLDHAVKALEAIDKEINSVKPEDGPVSAMVDAALKVIAWQSFNALKEIKP